MKLEFKGEGIEEKAYVVRCNNPEYQIKSGEVVVAIDPYYFRPTEVDLLLGDPSKAKKMLGWEAKYSVKDIVKEMIESDIHLFKREKLLSENYFKINNF